MAEDTILKTGEVQMISEVNVKGVRRRVVTILPCEEMTEEVLQALMKSTERAMRKMYLEPKEDDNARR